MIIKLKIGNYKIPVNVEKNNGKLYLQFGFNRDLINEIKIMESAKWHGYEDPPLKIWSIKDSPRNRFQLDYLQGKNPYSHYDKPLVEYVPIKNNRNLYKHQIEMIRHGITRQRCIFACDLGTGKSLAAIEVAEHIKPEGFYWVAPKSALYSVMLELNKWKVKEEYRSSLFTYESLKKIIEDWKEEWQVPQMVIFDECQRLKNPTAQRTQAAAHLANAIREKWKDDAYIILMSGSPAPKSPSDWFSLCDIACPGFLREGNINSFKKRLGLIETKEGQYGAYPHLITWLDDEKKCSICGKYQDDDIHNMVVMSHKYHEYKKSRNEVSYLYERMKGLVLVKLKKDCLSELPDKIYRVVECPPSINILNAAKIIKSKCPTTIQALTLLRELSDGFQYQEEETEEKETCELCKGNRTIPISINPQEISSGDEKNNKETICPNCKGTGEIRKTTRNTISLPSPKENILRDVLDEHDDIGRLVVYAGFTGSVNHCVNTIKSLKWNYIRVDGRGWETDLLDNIGRSLEPQEMLKVFQSRITDDSENKILYEKYPRVCFIGQPSAGGLGLTLTASPTILYYSNDFNFESRFQSEGRIHRIGMDINKGATIIDIIHLPTDKLILDNLQKKNDLQNLSLGILNEVIK